MTALQENSLLKFPFSRISRLKLRNNYQIYHYAHQINCSEPKISHRYYGEELL